MREYLSDVEWEVIWKALRGFPAYASRGKQANRLFVEAVLYIATEGCSWRALPRRYGNWNTVYNRYRYWALHGLWAQIALAATVAPDHLLRMVDSTIIKAHPHAAGAQKNWAARASAIPEADSPPSSTSAAMGTAYRSNLN